MADARKESLESLADFLSDYREGDVPRPTAAHIGKWLRQFPENAQDEMLAEITYMFQRTYISRERMTIFLKGLVTNEKLCGKDTKAFWQRANLLDIQQGGNSQREMLAMFGKILEQEVGLTLDKCGDDQGPFIYLDDGVFGGGRVRQDISTWIQKSAPQQCELHVIVAVLHLGGHWFASQQLDKVISASKKKVSLKWWRIFEVENRLYFRNESDVLWPTAVPAGPLADAYVKYMTEEEPKYKLTLRKPGSVGKKTFFSSDHTRIQLEQQLLAAGLHIRSKCARLPETARPLGATLLKTFGFGSTVVTFRNCPNNCPLAFWVGDPWYPLFPRSTNSDAFVKRLMASFQKKKTGS